MSNECDLFHSLMSDALNERASVKMHYISCDINPNYILQPAYQSTGIVLSIGRSK